MSLIKDPQFSSGGKFSDIKVYEPRYIAYLAASGSKRETTK